MSHRQSWYEYDVKSPVLSLQTFKVIVHFNLWDNVYIKHLFYAYLKGKTCNAQNYTQKKTVLGFVLFPMLPVLILHLESLGYQFTTECNSCRSRVTRVLMDTLCKITAPMILVELIFFLKICSFVFSTSIFIKCSIYEVAQYLYWPGQTGLQAREPYRCDVVMVPAHYVLL